MERWLRVLALLPLLVNVGESADCAAGASTLTTEGCSACDEYALCLGFTSSASCTSSDCETADGCTYDCLSVDADATTLAVLVLFGDYESSQEIAAEESDSGFSDDLSSYSDYTSSWPWVSNDQVTAIDVIDLSDAVTTLMISGGNNTGEYPKSKVADITFGTDLISTETSVTQVVLHNLNLQDQVDSLPDLLPSSVEVLNLGNALIESFPAALRSMESLQELYMDLNYVTTVSADDVIESLTLLSMQDNNIKNFTAVFPNLQLLSLNSNGLTEIPAAVYEHTNLTELDVTGNSFDSYRFTQDQIDFLLNLEVLQLESSDFSVDFRCDESKKTVVHDVTLCLTEDVVTSASSASSVASDSSTSSQATASDGNSSSSVGVGAIVGIVCAVVVVLAVGVAVGMCCRRHKQQQRDKLSEGVDETDIAHGYFGARQQPQQTYGGSTQSGASTGLTLGVGSIGSSAAGALLSLWSDPEMLSLQVRAEEIEDIRQLGSGAFGVVWLVRYRKSQLLASKRLRRDAVSKAKTLAFVAEIKLIAKFDHPHLVKLIGAAWTIESDLQALLEYMSGGDLYEYLHASNTVRSWTDEKFGMALGIIEALVYLHSFLPPLVHRDLKSRNVLLSDKLEAKLTDFGASRFRSEENTMTAGVGTGRWLAPEVITGDTNYGPAADIYSFGVLLAELDTHEMPYSSTRGPNGDKLSDVAILQLVVNGNLRPQLGTAVPAVFQELVDECLAANPSQRPAAPAVAYRLRSMKKDVVRSVK